MKKTVLMIFILMAVTLADEIVFTNGDTLYNCYVITEKESEILVTVNMPAPTNIQISKEFILDIHNTEYDTTKISDGYFEVLNIVSGTSPRKTRSSSQTQGHTTFDIKSVPSTITMLTLSYYFLDSGFDLEEQYNDLKESFTDRNSETESQILKFKTYGVIFGLSGIFNVVLNIDNVKMEATSNGVAMAYHF